MILQLGCRLNTVPRGRSLQAASLHLRESESDVDESESVVGPLGVRTLRLEAQFTRILLASGVVQSHINILNGKDVDEITNQVHKGLRTKVG